MAKAVAAPESFSPGLGRRELGVRHEAACCAPAGPGEAAATTRGCPTRDGACRRQAEWGLGRAPLLGACPPNAGALTPRDGVTPTSPAYLSWLPELRVGGGGEVVRELPARLPWLSVTGAVFLPAPGSFPPCSPGTTHPREGKAWPRQEQLKHSPAELLFLKVCVPFSSQGAGLLWKEHEIFMSDFTN